MRLYLAGGTATIIIFCPSIFAFFPFVQHQVPTLRANGGQNTRADKPLFHLAGGTAPITIFHIPIIASLSSEIEFPEPIATELLERRADRRNAEDPGAHPPLLNQALRRAPVMREIISIVTLLSELEEPIWAVTDKTVLQLVAAKSDRIPNPFSRGMPSRSYFNVYLVFSTTIKIPFTKNKGREIN